MSRHKKPSQIKSPAQKRRRNPPAINRELPSAPATEEVALDHEAASTLPATPTGRPLPTAFPSPEKAYKNLDFLASPAGRLIRIQCELTEPGTRFRKHHVNNTIVLFGSARIPHPDRAAEELTRIEKEIAQEKSISREQKNHLDRARRLKRASHYYEEANQLSNDLTKWSTDNIPNPAKRFYICSGGGPGIMEAANRGAYEAGGKSVALGISLPFEQHLNVYADDDLGFEFHYFFVRKYWFLYLAKALVVFPGGFGTLDELFEMLTLIQTQKTQKYVPIVLYGKEFWNEVINFQALLEWGVISSEDLDLFKICDTVEETRDYLIQELTSYYLEKKS
jgi:uncharacterized protein (TIGR00730 family)